jgi:hypothetical protein
VDKFLKNRQISNFVKIRPVRDELSHPDGRTNMTKPVVAFHNFANAPKNCSNCKIDFTLYSVKIIWRSWLFCQQRASLHFSYVSTKMFRYSPNYTRKTPTVMIKSSHIYFASRMFCSACLASAAIVRLCCDVVIMCNVVIMSFQDGTASINRSLCVYALNICICCL